MFEVNLSRDICNLEISFLNLRSVQFSNIFDVRISVNPVTRAYSANSSVYHSRLEHTMVAVAVLRGRMSLNSPFDTTWLQVPKVCICISRCLAGAIPAPSGASGQFVDSSFGCWSEIITSDQKAEANIPSLEIPNRQQQTVLSGIADVRATGFWRSRTRVLSVAPEHSLTWRY